MQGFVRFLIRPGYLKRHFPLVHGAYLSTIMATMMRYLPWPSLSRSQSYCVEVQGYILYASSART